ncbi:hypothetical protein LA343_03260 [Corynebacterium falsenii]|uniref:hypothetical protein n=1 Tax=Corynebacterium falsenii TaxID=108486 RepID=UPI0004AFBFF5|nr:hypothetical protein [Corynebacterium falsenii]UBI05191.1 hypothetical protein LA343_03260 [Corynebacterium falsenii]
MPAQFSPRLITAASVAVVMGVGSGVSALAWHDTAHAKNDGTGTAGSVGTADTTTNTHLNGTFHTRTRGS